MLQPELRDLLLRGWREHRSKAEANGTRLPSDEEAIRRVETDWPVPVGAPRGKWDLSLKPFADFFRRAETGPVVRLLFLVESWAYLGKSWLHFNRSTYEALDLHRREHRLGPCELAAALAPLGVPERAVLRELLNDSPMLDWAGVPEFLDRHARVLADLVQDRYPPDLSPERKELLKALARHMPVEVFPLVLERALDGKKPFKEVLKDAERLIPALTEQLRARKAGRRLEAVRWLRELRAPLEPLREALAIERDPKVQVELQRALGTPVPVKVKLELPFEVPSEAVPIVATALELRGVESWPELDRFLAAYRGEPLADRLLPVWRSDPERYSGLTAVLAGTLEARHARDLIAWLDELPGPVLAMAARMRPAEGSQVVLHGLYRSRHARLARAELKRWQERIPFPGVFTAVEIRELWAERLREHWLCGRRWKAEVWRERWYPHPLVHDLVWQAGDRALSAEEAAGVGGELRLAHTVTLPAIPPVDRELLLPQFPSDAVPLAAEERRRKRLRDVAGQVLEDRVLWKRASALGWKRYRPDDPSFYHALHKPLPGLEPVHAFLLIPKGAGYPEHGLELGLGDLLFAPPGDDLRSRVLGSLPEVWVAEIRREVRGLVAAN